MEIRSLRNDWGKEFNKKVPIAHKMVKKQLKSSRQKIMETIRQFERNWILKNWLVKKVETIVSPRRKQEKKNGEFLENTRKKAKGNSILFTSSIIFALFFPL